VRNVKTLRWCQRRLAVYGLRAVTHRGHHPYSLPFRGYCVVDGETNFVVAGCEILDFSFDLDDLVDYVTSLDKAA
jgi:hypothetical protein